MEEFMILETEALEKEYLLKTYASSVWVSFWLNKASVFLLKELFYVYEYICMYVCMCTTCMYTEEVISPSGTRVRDVCEPLCEG